MLDTAIVELPNSVSYLSQKPLILSKTIRENIILELEESQDKLLWAIKHALLEEDLSIMENGLDTIVGESGQTLSGGQRVRVA